MIPSTRLVLLAAVGLVPALLIALARVMAADGQSGGSQDELLVPLLFWDVAVALLALVDAHLSRRWRVEVERQLPQVLSVGRNNAVQLEIGNPGRGDLTLLVQDDGAEFVLPIGMPQTIKLLGNSRETLRYYLQPLRRGAHTLGHIWLRAPSILGLWQRQVIVKADQIVRVYPDLQQVRQYDMLVRDARGEHFAHSVKKRGGESEFERLREYTRDDDVRRIDWKATARKGTPIAREYQLERNQNIVFALDLGRLMTAEAAGLSQLDHALNATLMLAHVSVKAGDCVGLAAFDSEMRTFLAPQAGAAASKRLIQATYDLFPSLVEPDYREMFAVLRTRLRKRSLIILFTQVLDPATQKMLVPLIRSLSPTHIALCVQFRDDSVEALLQLAPTDELSLYTRAVAAAEVQWRQRLVEELRRAGAHVLHVRPQELTQQLISKYMDIKRRQLL